MLCPMARLTLPLLALVAGLRSSGAELDSRKKHHHHHHGHHGHHHGAHHKHHHHALANDTAAAAEGATADAASAPAAAAAVPAVAAAGAAPVAMVGASTDRATITDNADKKPESSDAAAHKEKLIIDKMRALEEEITTRHLDDLKVERTHLRVNAPLPADFAKVFKHGISLATGCRAADVRIISSEPLPEVQDVDEIVFEAPRYAVRAAAEQAADPDSKLANGPLRLLLTARDSESDEKSAEKEEKEHENEEEDEEEGHEKREKKEKKEKKHKKEKKENKEKKAL